MVPETSGPFDFNDFTIDTTVKLKSPGVYLLGYSMNNTFFVERVGRSDTNLNARLKSAEYRGNFRQFKARYCPSAEQAFHEECALWHAYGTGKGNPYHPARPAGINIRCKHCTIFN